MAEQEIIKHVEAAIAVTRDRTKKWQHKLMEILLEVGIIVFAVSLSIWFHNWSESLKDRSEARQFLAGLKGDLRADSAEMESDLANYRKELRGMRYFARVGSGEALANDSMRAYSYLLFSFVHFDPRISRFEALKGSGKLNIIENKDLLLQIIDLYTKGFPLISRRNDWTNAVRQTVMTPYVMQHLQLDKSGQGTNWLELFQSTPMRFVMQSESVTNNIEAYSDVIQGVGVLMKEIDEELK